MSFTISAMAAATFSYAGGTVDLQVSTAGAPLVATVPAVAGARVHLAPSASDLVRVLVAAFNAAPGLPGGVSFAASMGTDGRITITCTGDTWKSADLHSSLVGRILGYSASATPYAASHTATLQPMFVAYAVSVERSHRRSMRQGAYGVTFGGRVYGWGASAYAHRRELRLAFIPRSPAIATAEGSTATPLEPADAYRDSYGSTATARAWSWQDLAAVAPNAAVAWTGEFQTLRTSTTDTYDVGYLSPEALMELADDQLDASWDCYHTLELTLHLPTSGSTATRS